MNWRIGLLATLLTVLLMGNSHAAIVDSYSASVDFNSAADLSDFTSLGSTGSVNTATYNAATGSNGVSGRLEYNGTHNASTAGQRVLYYTPASASNGLIQMPATGVATLSIDFLAVDATNNAPPRIGFHENNTANFSVNADWNNLMVLPRGGSSKT
jgi:hypothetical protein